MFNPKDIAPAIRDETDLQTIQSIWEQLSSQHPHKELHGTFPGYLAWAQSDPDARPLVLTAWRDGRPVALLPTHRDSRRIAGLSLRILSPTGTDHWRAGIPVSGADPDCSIATLLQGLCRRRDWDMLQPPALLEDGEILRLLLSHGQCLHMHPRIVSEMDDPIVSLTGYFEDYYVRLSGNLRSQVKRAEARLQCQGPVSFEEYTTGPQLDSRLDEFLRIEASGWKGRQRSAIASDPRLRDFYTRLTHEAARRGWLRLHMLRVGSQCVAADYCLAPGNTVYMLKVAYDEAFSHCSPGQVLRKRVLQHLFNTRSHQIYDLLPGGGDHQDYKRRFATSVRRWLVVRLFNPNTLRGRIAAAASRLRARLQAPKENHGS